MKLILSEVSVQLYKTAQRKFMEEKFAWQIVFMI
jgi:hypothetical protein